MPQITLGLASTEAFSGNSARSVACEATEPSRPPSATIDVTNCSADFIFNPG